MKQGIKHLQSLIAVALCIIMSTALYSCSDDDDDEPNNNAIVGEWIKRNGDDCDIYYHSQLMAKAVIFVYLTNQGMTRNILMP